MLCLELSSVSVAYWIYSVFCLLPFVLNGEDCSNLPNYLSGRNHRVLCSARMQILAASGTASDGTKCYFFPLLFKLTLRTSQIFFDHTYKRIQKDTVEVIAGHLPQIRVNQGSPESIRLCGETFQLPSPPFLVWDSENLSSFALTLAGPCIV